MTELLSHSVGDIKSSEQRPTRDDVQDIVPTLSVIGGCMVGGYGLGGGAPFWHGLADRLGLKHVEVNIVEPVNFQKCLETLYSFAQQKTGSTLLLQLGHYDFGKFGRAINRQSLLAGSRRTVASSAGGGVGGGLPKANGSAYIAQLCIGYLTIILDVLQSRSRIRRQRTKFRRSIHAILAKAHELEFERIVVLSPFPTAKARSNRHRLIGRKLLREAALEAKVEWVDVWKRFPLNWLYGSPALPSMLHDVIHLNEAGHRLVESCLVEAEMQRGQA